MSTEVEYYVPLKFVSIKNPEVISFALQAQFYGQRLRKELWIDVGHPKSSKSRETMVNSTYHTIMHAAFDSAEKSPMRKLTLALAGDWGEPEQALYAKLWFNLDDYHNCGVTLSPLPFDGNGRVELHERFMLQAVVLFLKYFVQFPSVLCYPTSLMYQAPEAMALGITDEDFVSIFKKMVEYKIASWSSKVSLAPLLTLGQARQIFYIDHLLF